MEVNVALIKHFVRLEQSMLASDAAHQVRDPFGVSIGASFFRCRKERQLTFAVLATQREVEPMAATLVSFDGLHLSRLTTNQMKHGTVLLSAKKPRLFQVK